MDNTKTFYDDAEAFYHALQNQDDYPCAVLDFNGNPVVYMVGAERMNKIFEATERALLSRFELRRGGYL